MLCEVLGFIENLVRNRDGRLHTKSKTVERPSTQPKLPPGASLAALANVYSRVNVPGLLPCEGARSTGLRNVSVANCERQLPGSTWHGRIGFVHAGNHRTTGLGTESLRLSGGEVVQEVDDAGPAFADQLAKLLHLSSSNDSCAVQRCVEALGTTDRLRPRDSATLNDRPDNLDSEGSQRSCQNPNPRVRVSRLRANQRGDDCAGGGLRSLFRSLRHWSACPTYQVSAALTERTPERRMRHTGVGRCSVSGHEQPRSDEEARRPLRRLDAPRLARVDFNGSQTGGR